MAVRPPLATCTEEEFMNDVMLHLKEEDPLTKLVPPGGERAASPQPHTLLLSGSSR
jgi:hypothetical protein